MVVPPGVLQSAPKLPPAPQLSAPAKEEPASDPKPAPNPVSKAVTPAKDVPAQAQAAIEEVQQSADQTVEAAPGAKLPALMMPPTIALQPYYMRLLPPNPSFL